MTTRWPQALNHDQQQLGLTQFGRFQVGRYSLGQRLLALLFALGMLFSGYLPAQAASDLTSLVGTADGDAWLAASAIAKSAYCEKAYRAFRGSPSQSYIISSSVQAMDPERLCQRLDQFYRYDVNIETRLDEAAAIAPLLFADVSPES